MLNTVGTQSYPVVFTPEDSNYNPYRASVSVTVAKAPYEDQTHSVSVRYDDTSTQTVSLAGKIPADCGTVSLRDLRMVTLEGTAPVIESDFKGDGNNIVFALVSGLTEENPGTTTTLTVTVTTANYEDFDVVLTVNVVKEVTRAITFYANGGSGSMSPVTVADGASYTLPACGFAAPQRYALCRLALRYHR